MTRRVVLVSYFFPPTGGVSVARTLQPARRLPEHGWEPLVVAPRQSGHGIQDPAGLDRLPPELAVSWTRCPEPSRLRARGRAATAPGTPQAAPGPSLRGLLRPRRWLARLLRAAFGAWRRMAFPDEQVPWIPFAAWAAIRTARRNHAQAILSTASPISAHVAAWIAARVLGIAWVADFRDPWAGNPLATDEGGLRGRLKAALERRLVARADRVTFVSPSLTRRYRARYPERADRMATITNGYDRAECAAAGAPGGAPDAGPPAGAGLAPFVLLYAGSLYRPAEVEAFIAGLRLAVRRDPGLADRLRVRFLGSASLEAASLMDAALADRILGRVLSFRPPVPRREALAAIRAADATLLLLPDGPGAELNVSGKLFDYLGCDRQVLAVVPEGDAREILSALDWGVVVPPTAEGVALGLVRIVATPAPRAVADPESRHEWGGLTARLAAVLDEAVAARAANASVGRRVRLPRPGGAGPQPDQAGRISSR